jgi:hypothetical protein
MAALIDLVEALPMSLTQGSGLPGRVFSENTSGAEPNAFRAVIGYHGIMQSVLLDEHPARRFQGFRPETGPQPPVNLWIVRAKLSPITPSEWLNANSASVTQYIGEWLLISAEGLVAHSTSFKDIKSVQQEKRLEQYLTYYVPRPDEAHFTL